MSKQPVNAASRVYGNPTKYGYLLGSNSPLSENSQMRMMKDLIHKGQSDFLEHPVTRAWINTMTFVATGGIEGAVGIGKLGWSLFSRGAAKAGMQYTKSSLQLGQQMHNAYKVGDVVDGVAIKEFRGIKGIRPDFVDFSTKTIYELKPYNPRGIQMGTQQLNRYKSILETAYPGTTWKTVLDLY